MGPNTEPCGTPDVTDSSSEQSPSSTTVRDLPIKNDEIHFRGKILLFNLLGLNLKSGGLHFFKVFYH